MAHQYRSGRDDQTMLGIVFTADSLDLAEASRRAWRLWMERLDPMELRGAALYDGAMVFTGGHPIFVIAISSVPATIAYVQAAFAAPDLLAFPGVAPIAHRFIPEQSLPREQLAIRGYISGHGQFLPSKQEQQQPLATAPRIAPVVAPAPVAVPWPGRADHVATTVLRATPLDGATLIHLRIWRSSFAHKPHVDRRWRILFALVGSVVILGSLGFFALRLAPKTEGQSTPPTSTTGATFTNGPLMIVAPLALRVACTPGKTTAFTISNNGTQPLEWANNAGQFEPPLALSALSGTVAPGDSQVVQVTTSTLVSTQQTDMVVLTGNSDTVHISITIGGCPLA